MKPRRRALAVVAALLAFGIIDLVVLGAQVLITGSIEPPARPPELLPGIEARDRVGLIGLGVLALEGALATPWRALFMASGAGAALLKVALLAAALWRPRLERAGGLLALGLIGLAAHLLGLLARPAFNARVAEQSITALAELGIAQAVGGVSGALVWWGGLCVLALLSWLGGGRS